MSRCAPAYFSTTPKSGIHAQSKYFADDLLQPADFPGVSAPLRVKSEAGGASEVASLRRGPRKRLQRIAGVSSTRMSPTRISPFQMTAECHSKSSAQAHAWGANQVAPDFAFQMLMDLSSWARLTAECLPGQAPSASPPEQNRTARRCYPPLVGKPDHRA